MVERAKIEVWDILDEVIQDHPVMLNRAPTLHRLAIQAFQPVLIEGKAIKLHPLVCTAFNADFDGDQMAVHIPFSLEAQIEARVLMMSTNNVLSPPPTASRSSSPSQDCAWSRRRPRDRPFALGEGRIFSSPMEVNYAHSVGELDIHAKIKCRVQGGFVTPRWAACCSPRSCRKPSRSRVTTARWIRILRISSISASSSSNKDTVLLADALMSLGYKRSTRAGTSISIHDMLIPQNKSRSFSIRAISKFRKSRISNIEGLITDGERYNKVVIDIWAQLSSRNYVADEENRNGNHRSGKRP